jgi:DNA-binding NtrC family response regulator
MVRNILVLDAADAPLAELISALAELVQQNARVDVVRSAAEFERRLTDVPPIDVCVVPYPEGDGQTTAVDVMRRIRSLDADVPLIACAARGDVHVAAEAVNAGATDFLVRGDRLRERLATLIGKVRRTLALVDRNRDLHEQNLRLRQRDHERALLVGESPQILEVVACIRRVAAIPRPVLIVGERGTGKELVARAIHTESGRGDRPFIAVNCAAFPETLLESELFGHERGAFTGAERQVPGRFEQAAGGSLFLDEISRMPPSFQQKILRVVEYGTFTRIGGTREIRSNARVVAASNADLQECIRQGAFLPDLYDRLAFEVVRVPPLRERRGDIALLARHFLRAFLAEVPALGDKTWDEAALAALERYPFPGNVRELKTIVERAAYRDTTREINVEDLALPDATVPGTTAAGTFRERVEAFERQLIVEALAASDGNQADAARRLGLAYHRFRYYAGKHRSGLKTED